jgi:hypothetical protein
MNKGIGAFLLNAAVAAYLFATGILGLTGKKFLSDGEIRRAVSALARGNFAEALVVILSVAAIVAGAAVLLKFFGLAFPMAEASLFILALLWMVFIVMADIYLPLAGKGGNFVEWLRNLGSHLMVLSGILLAAGRFGG